MAKIKAPKMDVGISKDSRGAIANGLSRLLADEYTLYLKTHNFHWNVTGPMFQTLHLMFEQHYTAGGYTHSYERNGYEWDVGVHYIGDMGKPTTMGRKLFDHITDGSLQWEPMDPDFDHIFLGDRKFTLTAGKAAYRERLIEQFPEDAEAIDTYLRYIKSVRDSLHLFTLEKVLPGPASMALRKGREKKQPPFFNLTTREVLEQITDNQTLIAVLTGQWGDNGLPPAQSSFIIHCMIAQHYMNGGYYPVGGASRMAESIIPVIQASGGEVFTYASVDSIELEKGKAVGVVMADGQSIRAPLGISNAGFNLAICRKAYCALIFAEVCIFTAC